MSIHQETNINPLLSTLIGCPFEQIWQTLKPKSHIDGDFLAELEHLIEQTQLIAPGEDWAKLVYIRGLCYFLDSNKYPAVYLQKAIQSFDQSLQVFTQKLFPQEWSTLNNSLGNAYRSLGNVFRTRQEGDSLRNIQQATQYYQQAIQYYQKSLQKRTREVHPREWADTQFNLGVSYGELAQLSDLSAIKPYLQKAIIHLQCFLEFTSPEEKTTVQQAQIKRAIGIFHQELGYLSLTQHTIQNTEPSYQINHLNLALFHYFKALQFHEFEQAPLDWAASQNDLGMVYVKMDEIEKALECFQEALKVFTPTTFPEECSRVGRNLGRIASRAQQWQLAVDGFDKALSAIEIQRNRSNSDERRQAIISEARDDYAQMVDACVALHRELDEATDSFNPLAKAMETIERFRSRYLADLMLGNDLSNISVLPKSIRDALNIFQEKQKQLDELRAQYESKIMPGNSTIKGEIQPDKLRTISLDCISTSQTSTLELKNIKTQLEKLAQEQLDQWLQLRKYDPVLAGQLSVDPPTFTEIQSLIDDPSSAIISFFSARQNTYVFILHQHSISYHVCAGLGHQDLNEWLKKKWFEPYFNDVPEKINWIARMPQVLKELATKLELDIWVPQYLSEVEELILIPQYLLHLIPFAALPLGDQYFGDRYQVRQIPSCQILSICKKRSVMRNPASYGAVVDATNDLHYSRIEGKLLQHLWQIPDHRYLVGDVATKDNYRNLIHSERIQAVVSSHHAKYNPDCPLESALSLNDAEITLQELLTLTWRMPELDEVFLSCCETVLGEPSPTDDLITLAGGFLCAGARGVIGSLWSVQDKSAALLSYYYHTARKQGMTRPRSLQFAQQTLRGLSHKEMEKVTASAREAETQIKSQVRGTSQYYEMRKRYKHYQFLALLIRDVLDQMREQPLSHPFYWASFVCQGMS